MMGPSRTLMALAIAATMVVELAMAANYTVGDSGGWEIGPDYQSWVSSKNFTIGDVIIFQYSANHDVLEVNEQDFSSCSASNPKEKHTGGTTAITLLTSGKRFFICGVPGHCLAGMKVEIDTLATPSPPPPSMETPPPSSPAPDATPSPPPSSPAPDVTPSPPPTSSPTAPTSSPAPPPKAATKPPAKSPLAPPPDSKASPPAPPSEPTTPSSAPTPEAPIPPFPFDKPLIPSAAPKPPPPPPSSAYKCSFKVHLSVGFALVVIMLLAL